MTDGKNDITTGSLRAAASSETLEAAVQQTEGTKAATAEPDMGNKARYSHGGAEDAAVQFQFAEKLLDICNARRDALEVRATVVATIGLALVGFVLTQGSTVFGKLPILACELASLSVLLLTAASLAYCLQMVAPLKDASEHGSGRNINLTYLYHIPDHALGAYQKKIRALTSEGVVDETAKHVYELCGVLRSRYDALSRACGYLYAALAMLMLSVVGGYVWYFATRR